MHYPASRGCIALVMPICIHPGNKNSVVIYDLREDPHAWRDLSIDEMKERIQTPKEKLPQGVNRIPLKTLRVNSCPIVTSPAVLKKEQAEKFQVDVEACRAHWEQLQGDNEIKKKVSAVFSDESFPEETDPDLMIYSGAFFSDVDRDLMEILRATRPNDLGRLDLPFRDGRLQEMFFRYRARNYPDTLNQADKERWKNFRKGKILAGETIARFEKEMKKAWQKVSKECDEKSREKSEAVLNELQDYTDELIQSLME